MDKRYLPTRVLVTSVFASILIALAASPTIAPVSAQENLEERIPRIEIIQLNHAGAPLAQQATFESARVVHRVKYNNKWWMRIHIKFRIKNALSTPCKMIAYFFDDDDEPLEASEDYPAYSTTQGKVYAGLDFTPSLNDAVYNDLQVYIPYEALNLDTDPGSEYDLKFYLSIYDESRKRHIAKSGWYEFSLKY